MLFHVKSYDIKKVFIKFKKYTLKAVIKNVRAERLEWIKRQIQGYNISPRDFLEWSQKYFTNISSVVVSKSTSHSGDPGAIPRLAVVR